MHADCKCTNTIKIPLGSIVEFQLTGYVSRDIDQAYHPVHIHGNSYFVVAQVNINYIHRLSSEFLTNVFRANFTNLTQFRAMVLEMNQAILLYKMKTMLAIRKRA